MKRLILKSCNFFVGEEDDEPRRRYPSSLFGINVIVLKGVEKGQIEESFL